MTHRVSIVIEQDDSGCFAYSPELPGCYSQGDSYEEAVQNITEAVQLYVETLEPEERKALSSKRGSDRITIPHHAGKTLHPKIVGQVLALTEEDS